MQIRRDNGTEAAREFLKGCTLTEEPIETDCDDSDAEHNDREDRYDRAMEMIDGAVQTVVMCRDRRLDTTVSSALFYARARPRRHRGDHGRNARRRWVMSETATRRGRIVLELGSVVG